MKRQQQNALEIATQAGRLYDAFIAWPRFGQVENTGMDWQKYLYRRYEEAFGRAKVI